MPETPDFDQIARRVVETLDAEARDEFDDDTFALRLAEQLRLIWNARGAADVATLEAALLTSQGVIRSYVELDKLIRTLDR